MPLTPQEQTIQTLAATLKRLLEDVSEVVEYLEDFTDAELDPNLLVRWTVDKLKSALDNTIIPLEGSEQ
jgi:hypothetical protein